MKKFLVVIAAFFAVVSCSKQDRENTMADQEKYIDTYISSLGDVRVQRNGGVSRIVYKEGVGLDSLAVGDSVKFYYSGYMFTRGKGRLFVTNVDSVAQAHQFPCSEAPECIKLEKGDIIDGFYYGLQGARAGEKCEIVFSAKYGYENTVVYNIPKLTSLLFEIQIAEIIKN